MPLEISIDDSGTIEIFAHALEWTFFLKDSVKKIGDAIEKQARIEAPIHHDLVSVEKAIRLGIKSPTPRDPKGGKLKEHPVDRDSFFEQSETQPPRTITNVPQFGGNTVSIRGPGGRFIKGKGLPDLAGTFIPGEPGHTVARETITLPDKPEWAVWVHEGVPTKHGNMNYVYHGGHVFMRQQTVAGFDANPYLLRAYEKVNHEFVPIEIEKLRAKIATF